MSPSSKFLEVPTANGILRTLRYAEEGGGRRHAHRLARVRVRVRPLLCIPNGTAAVAAAVSFPVNERGSLLIRGGTEGEGRAE